MTGADNSDQMWKPSKAVNDLAKMINCEKCGLPKELCACAEEEKEQRRIAIRKSKPIVIHCPHDKAELELVSDVRTPEGLLRCPKCHCKFRVCLATFDKDCLRLRGNGPKSGVLLTTPFSIEMPKKRGRPAKKEKVEWQDGPMQEVPEEGKENAN